MNDLLKMFIGHSIFFFFLSTLTPLGCNSTFIFHCSHIYVNQSSWKPRQQRFKTNDKTFSLFPWVLSIFPIANTSISGYFCKPWNYTKITFKSFPRTWVHEWLLVQEVLMGAISPNSNIAFYSMGLCRIHDSLKLSTWWLFLHGFIRVCLKVKTVL